MNAQQEEALTVLGGLIGIAREGQECFRNAAEAIGDDTELRMLLSSFSLQRAKFAGELEALSIAMGEHDAEHEGEATLFHRGWVQLRSLISGKSLYAILSECERAERIAKDAYQKALRNDLPGPVRDLIRSQRQEVIATHNTLRTLRDAAAPRAGKREIGSGTTLRNGAADVWQEMKDRTGRMKDSGSGWMRRHPGGIVVAALGAGFILGLTVYLMELRNERARMLTGGTWRRWLGARADEGLEAFRGLRSSKPVRRLTRRARKEWKSWRR